LCSSQRTQCDERQPCESCWSPFRLSGTNGYDLLFRRTNLVVRQSGTPIVRQSFTYDGASRLATVTDNSGATPYSATYDSNLRLSLQFVAALAHYLQTGHDDEDDDNQVI
jgi:hypothetical protein